MTKTIRFMKFLCLSTLAVGSLAGCGGAEDGALQEGSADESIAQTSQALNFFVPFRLHNLQTNLCMGVQAGTPTHGTPIITWSCDGSTNQTWKAGQFIASPSGFFQLVNGVVIDPTKLKCLAGTAINGTQTRIENCTQTASQGWRPEFVGLDSMNRECFRFELGANPNLVLGVAGANPNPGGKVVIWPKDGSLNQIWCAQR